MLQRREKGELQEYIIRDMTIPGKQAMFEKVVLKLGCRTLTL